MDRLHVVVQRSNNKRYIEEEKDESDPEERTSASPRRHVKNGLVEVKNAPVQRNLHNFLITKAMKAQEDLLESLSSLLSNESSGNQFLYSIFPAH